MKTRHLVMLAVIAGLAAMIVLAGCKKKEETAAPAKTKEVAATEIEQTVCPVMGNKIDKNIFVEYKGKKVYFCCAECKAKFEAEPEKYISKLPQFKQ